MGQWDIMENRPASEVAVYDLIWECMMYEMDEARANAIAVFQRDAKSRDPSHASLFLEQCKTLCFPHFNEL